MGAMSPSGAGFSPIDPQIPEDASAGAAAGLLAGLAIGTESGSSSFGPVGALVGGIIGGTVGFFQDLLSGGSGGLPGWIVWKLNHQGGNLQLWAQIIGIDPALAPSWQPTAGIQLVGDNTPPLQKPEYGRPKQPGMNNAPSPTPRQSRKPGLADCLVNAAASPLVIAPIVCAGSGVGCLQAEAPGLNLLSCRVALATCTTTAAVVAACYAGTELPEF